MTVETKEPKAAATTPISITTSALEQLARIREEKNVPADLGLRVGVRGGGCAGFEYELGFDQRKDGDQSFKIGEETVFMQPGHALYLIGMEIDWATGLDNRGFTFNNPNASETCGCGTSFSA
ncbi:MAG: iron-sulfur cluster assembly accessory protein [Bacteroidota bacterium]